MSEIDFDVGLIDKMKVVDLKGKLKAFGLSTTGLKTELIARLKMYVSDMSGSPISVGSVTDDILVSNEMVAEYINNWLANLK